MITVVISSLHRSGMALFPFILLKNEKDRNNKILINHEKIHIRQQLELLVLPFYVFYILHYLLNRLRGNNHETAYRNIVFEKEAYENDDDLNYLEKRKLWGFCKYF